MSKEVAALWLLTVVSLAGSITGTAQAGDEISALEMRQVCRGVEAAEIANNGNLFCEP